MQVLPQGSIDPRRGPFADSQPCIELIYCRGHAGRASYHCHVPLLSGYLLATRSIEKAQQCGCSLASIGRRRSSRRPSIPSFEAGPRKKKRLRAMRRQKLPGVRMQLYSTCVCCLQDRQQAGSSSSERHRFATAGRPPVAAAELLLPVSLLLMLQPSRPLKLSPIIIFRPVRNSGARPSCNISRRGSPRRLALKKLDEKIDRAIRGEEQGCCPTSWSSRWLAAPISPL